MAAPLTPKQAEIYDFILQYTRTQGYPPSVREIGAAVHLKSPSTVHFHMKKLEAEGYIQKADGKTRAITLPREDMPEETEARADQVPLVGDVAAGSPILAEECVEEYLTFDTGGRTGEHFALRVRGESMLGAGILPGDLVVVHRQESFQDGDIVVALFEDEATVKTLSRTDGHIWLLPENPAYQPIDGEGAALLGRVVAVIRRY